MVDITPVELSELRRLEREATPGPWYATREGNQYVGAQCTAASRIEELARPWNPHRSFPWGSAGKEMETARFEDNDADLIAALRNALPRPARRRRAERAAGKVAGGGAVVLATPLRMGERSGARQVSPHRRRRAVARGGQGHRCLE